MVTAQALRIGALSAHRPFDRGSCSPSPIDERECRSGAQVAIAHGNAIIAAGLGSLIREDSRWPVLFLDPMSSNIWDGIVGKHIVLADEATVHRTLRAGGPSIARPAWSRLVLVGRKEAATESDGRCTVSDATISTDCSSSTLLNVIERLVAELKYGGEVDATPGSTASFTGDCPSGKAPFVARPDGGMPARRKGGLAPHALRRVREHVAAHYTESIDVDRLAAIAGLSAHHFARAFKQSLGVPPHRYVLLRRISAAAELVRDTDRSFAEIGTTVGFSDQSHFSRAFIAMTGERPSAFRRMHR